MDSKMEEEILNRLGKRNLTDIANDVKGLLQGDDKVQQMKFVMKFFKNITGPLYKVDFSDDLEEIVSSIDICCEALIEKGHDTSSVNNILTMYHTLVLLIKWRKYTSLISLSKILYRLLETSENDSKLAPVKGNAYVLLWNSAGEADKHLTDPSLAFQLRIQALWFLVFKGDILAIVEKATTAAAQFVYRVKTSKDLCFSGKDLLNEYTGLLEQLNLIAANTHTASSLKVKAFFDFLMAKKDVSSAIGHSSSLSSDVEAVKHHFSDCSEFYKLLLVLSDVLDQAYSLGKSTTSCQLSHSINFKQQFDSVHHKIFGIIIKAICKKVVEYEISACTLKDFPIKLEFLNFGILLKEMFTYVLYHATEEHVKICLMALSQTFALIASEVEGTKTLPESLELSYDLCPDLTEEIIKKFNASALSEVSNLGSYYGLIGNVSYQKGDYKAASFFSRKSFEMIKLSLLYKKLSDDNKEIYMNQLWQKCELACWTLRQQEKLEEAADLISQAYLVSQNAALAVDLWIKLKRNASKLYFPILQKRTLQEHISSTSNCELQESSKLDLLYLETQASMKEGNLSQSCVNTFKQLLSLPASLLMKASFYVKLSQFLWSKRSCELEMDMSSDGAARKAIQILEASSDDKSESKLILASAYFWLYLNSWREVQIEIHDYLAKTSASPVQEKQANPVDPNSKEEKEDSFNIAHPHIKVGNEFFSQKTLDKALHLWCSVLTSPSDIMRHKDLLKELSTLEALKVSGEIYALSCRVREEIQICTLFHQICQVIGTASEKLLSTICLATSLLRLGLVNVAARLVKECRDTEEVESALRLRFLLLKAEIYYHQEKFADGVYLLKKIFSHSSLDKIKNTVSDMMLLVKARLVAALYSLLPSKFDCSAFCNETPITLSQEAMKHALAVNKYLAKENKDMWLKLNATHILLDSVVMVGSLYRQIGAPREAYCFLKEYLNKTQEMILSAWTAKMLLLIAEVDLLCENVKDGSSRITGLTYVLNKETSDFSEAIKDKSSVSPFSSSPVDFHLSVKDGLPYKTFVAQYLMTPSGDTKEYIAKNKTISDFLNSLHKPACMCFFCQQLSFSHLQLEVNILNAHMQFTFQHVSNITNSVKQLLKCQQLLSEKFNKVASEIKMFLTNFFPSWSWTDKDLAAFSHSSGLSGQLFTSKAKIYEVASRAFFASSQYTDAYEHLERGIKILTSAGFSCKAFFPFIFATLVHLKVQLYLLSYKCHKDRPKVSQFISNSVESLEGVNFREFSDTPRADTGSPVRSNNTVQCSNVPKAPQKRLIKDVALKAYMDTLKTSVASVSVKKGFKVFDEFDSDDNQEPFPAEEPAGPKTRKKKEVVSKAKKEKTTKRPATRRTRGAESSSRTSAAARRPRPCRLKAEAPASDEHLPAESSSSKDAEVLFNECSDEKCLNNSAELFRGKPKMTSNGSSHGDDEEAVESVVRSSVSESTYSFHEESRESKTERNLISVKEKGLSRCFTGLSHLEVCQALEEAIKIVQHHPPCPLYADMCLSMVQLLNFKEETEGTVHKGAWYHSQAVGVTLRHLGLISLYRKAQKNIGDKSIPVPKESCTPSDLPKCVTARTDLLEFHSGEVPEQIQLDYLPKDWTVVQVSSVQSESNFPEEFAKTPDLYVCQYRKGCTPIMVHLSGSNDSQFHTSLLGELNKIITESTATMKMKEPSAWWNMRRSLDSRLKELTESMENFWMGCWKGVFLGKSTDSKYLRHVKEITKEMLECGMMHGLNCVDHRLLEVVIDSLSFLNQQDLAVAVHRLWNLSPTDDGFLQLMSKLQYFQKHPSCKSRHPVILILDKVVQTLPWENVPILRQHPVSRVPSLHHLQAQLQFYGSFPNNVFTSGVDCQRTYYILNPSTDLQRTQDYFEKLFINEGWEGVIGKPPPKEELITALSSKDLILYCGHGSGKSYLSGEFIERFQIKAAAILMGCSSGRLKTFGSKIEPYGVVLQYWMGGSPCVVANLWDVTDKDIDRFTHELLKLWLPQWSKKQHVNDLASVTQMSRDVCKLKYLIGAAPVVYGVPVVSIVR